MLVTDNTVNELVKELHEVVNQIEAYELYAISVRDLAMVSDDMSQLEPLLAKPVMNLSVLIEVTYNNLLVPYMEKANKDYKEMAKHVGDIAGKVMDN